MLVIRSVRSMILHKEKTANNRQHKTHESFARMIMQNSGSVYPHPGVVFCIVVRNMEPDACALCQFAAVNAVLVRICPAVIESTEKVFAGCGSLFQKGPHRSSFPSTNRHTTFKHVIRQITRSAICHMISVDITEPIRIAPEDNVR